MTAATGSPPRRRRPVVVVAVVLVVGAVLAGSPGTAPAGPRPGPGPATEGVRIRAFGVALHHGEPEGNIPAPVESLAATASGLGYWAATATGTVLGYGDAVAAGDVDHLPLNAPVVAIEPTPSGRGYWLVASDGGVFAFGDATFRGSMGGRPLNQPIVGMAATPSGRGYWLVASDGGVFAFGDATFRGSMGGRPLNEPVVGIEATSSGRGYWLVASDGGVFAFGDARFFGSTGDRVLARPIIGIQITPTGGGYWFVASDGGVFAFGDATFHGSLAGEDLPGPVTGFAAHPTGRGYWMSVADVGDTVAMWQSGGFDPPVLDGVARAADEADARWFTFHSRTVGLTGVWRPWGQAVQTVPPGWRVPMTATAVDPARATPVLGPMVATALGRGEVVMGRRSARLRGARVGDTVELVAADGTRLRRRIGAIASEDRLGSTELWVSLSDARTFGMTRATSARWWGFERERVDPAIERWVPVPRWWAVDRSWDPRVTDEVLPTVVLKELLGEFAYRPRGGPVDMEPSWVARNIDRYEIPILGRWTCNVNIAGQLRAALQEIADAGLAGAIDVADSNRYGGCWVPRQVRGSSAVSRHAWGVAVDINPSTNAYGATPSLDPRIVDIFRRHGFAWGGTWTKPDGMHFEWTGPPAVRSASGTGPGSTRSLGPPEELLAHLDQAGG